MMNAWLGGFTFKVSSDFGVGKVPHKMLGEHPDQKEGIGRTCRHGSLHKIRNEHGFFSRPHGLLTSDLILGARPTGSGDAATAC
jgi:hypothetical protein